MLVELENLILYKKERTVHFTILHNRTQVLLETLKIYLDYLNWKTGLICLDLMCLLREISVWRVGC